MPRVHRSFAIAIMALCCLLVPAAHTQQTVVRPKTSPKLEPVAETKLLMNGIADPNLRGLGKILRDKPREAEAWSFARGQALLIAEMGNLLMMRPPRTQAGQELWMAQAVELRDNGSYLARVVAAKDYTKSRMALAGLANVCNHCHQSFQVATRVNPFGDE